MLTFFARAFAVPGEGDEPRAMLGRVVYRLYPIERAVVFSGIDRSKPTTFALPTIIGQICAREGLDHRTTTFYDLRTSMHDGDLEPGRYEFCVVFLAPRSDDHLVVECAAEVDCPPVVARDFEWYINSHLYARDLGYRPPPKSATVGSDERDEDDDRPPGRRKAHRS